MREATPERLDAFYSDFLALLDRGINPFTMDGGEYFYLKSMHSPMRDGTEHPDLFANIQLNIMANKTGRAHFQPAEISRMELFSIDEPIFNHPDNYQEIHKYERPSKAESILVTAEYLGLIDEQARCDNDIAIDSRPKRSFKSISDEYSSVIGSSLELNDRHDFYMMKIALKWLFNRHSLDVIPGDREPSNEEVAEYSVKYNIYNAIRLADMTMKALPIDFSKLKKDEAEANYNAMVATEKAARSQYEMAKEGAGKEDKAAAAALVNQASGAVAEVESYVEEEALTSPIDGEIIERFPEVGELVGTGAPIFNIADMNDMWVTFSIREDLLAPIRIGHEIQAFVPALGNQEITLKVYYMKDMGTYAAWKATKSTGQYDAKTFEVRARPLQPVEGLRPGMSVIWKPAK